MNTTSQKSDNSFGSETFFLSEFFKVAKKYCSLVELFKSLMQPANLLNVLVYLNIPIRKKVPCYRDYEEMFALNDRREDFLMHPDVERKLRMSLMGDAYANFFMREKGLGKISGIKNANLILHNVNGFKSVDTATREALLCEDRDPSWRNDIAFGHAYLLNLLTVGLADEKNNYVRQWFIASEGLMIVAPMSSDGAEYLLASSDGGSITLRIRRDSSAINWKKTLLLCKVGPVVNS